MRTLAVVLCTLVACNAEAGNQACPPPTSPQGSTCVLREDAALGETLVLASGTHLNCRGHRLSAAQPGRADDPATADNEFAPSQPDLAFAVLDATDVTVQNCVLEGFDFGVYILGGGAHHVLENRMAVRTKGVALYGTNDNVVSNNEISLTGGAGLAIAIFRGVRGNLVTGNVIVSQRRPFTYQLDQPGPAISSVPPDSPFPDSGIAVGSGNGQFALFQLLIAGRLMQFPMDPVTSAAVDNVIEDNVIDTRGPGASTGINLGGLNAGTIVRGNILKSGTNGVTLGLVAPAPIRTPASCSVDTARRCVRDADCGAAGGTCPGPRTCAMATGTACASDADCPAAPVRECWAGAVQIVDSRPTGVLVENNQLLDATPTFGISDIGSHATMISGNNVAGATRAGIRVGGLSLEEATVTRNRLAGNRYGLSLDQTGATRFAAHITLNDLGGNGAAVGARTGYALPTDLAGNHWGRSCEAGGFLADDAQLFEVAPPTAMASITDGHPYGVPVALTADALLPATCY